MLTKKIVVFGNEIGDVYQDVYSLLRCLFRSLLVSRLESLTLMYRFGKIPVYLPLTPSSLTVDSHLVALAGVYTRVSHSRVAL